MSENENLRSLCFQLKLTTDDMGLTYRLSDFELTYFEYDAGSTGPLESFLSPEDNLISPFIKLFNEQLIEATKSW